MILFILCFAAGVGVLQQQAALPEPLWASLLLVPLLSYGGAHLRTMKYVRTVSIGLLGVGIGFFFAAAIAGWRLSDRLPDKWQGVDIEVIGVVAEMPQTHKRGSRFAFDVETVETPGAHVPKHILLSTYANEKYPPPTVHAGERWHFTLRLKQPHSTANPHQFDFEAWALERNLRAVGYVHGKGDNRLLQTQPGKMSYRIERLRETIRDNFQKKLGDAPLGGVLVALAVGDQASISAAQWQTFTRTGVNHLMSISGLHITLFSSLIFSLTYALWRRSSRLTLKFPARKAAALAGLFAALAYTLISGYGVPAQRTLYMLAALAGLLLASRHSSPLQILSIALFAVLLLDPWAILSAGFWLSFGAVALIFFVSAYRLPEKNDIAPVHFLRHAAVRIKRGLSGYARIQWAMTLGLIPPLLIMFQQISLVSPLANFLAIPLISFIVIPLTLLATLPVFDVLLHPALWFMEITFSGLVWLENSPLPVWTQHAPPLCTGILGIFGALCILLPGGFPARALGGILLLPLFLVSPEKPPEKTVRITVFDVGQGLSVAAQTAEHSLLYDAGPDFNHEANSGNRILVPALRGMGISRLDKLILSHDDSDHTGGASSILQALPVGEVLSSLNETHPLLSHSPPPVSCHEGQNWDWNGVHFEMLHPGVNRPELPPPSKRKRKTKKRDNDKGCVLRISAGQQHLLLTADTERDTEQQLLAYHPGELSSQVLIVPHHGSKSSSGEAFVAAIHPKYAIFSAGYRNAYGHPRAEIVQRYQEKSSAILRTDEAGAISIVMNDSGIQIARYRDEHRRYWQ